eukprot:TRINITY_DN363_c0_g1_i1.p1 TRINITY_DN363_c0_g1~~TRINITY_DN363_c0_g1_i1.p1  ORF type:complete len:179 (+),score=105.58 TRINITY_DN363_c0_g1_i1:33-539(+)
MSRRNERKNKGRASGGAGGASSSAAAVTADETGVREIFDTFDEDKDGRISTSKVGTAIRALGKTPTERELAEILAEVAGASEIDFKTFTNLYKKKMKTARDLESDMRAAFEAIDKEGNGTILEAELRQILTTLGEPLLYNEVDRLLRDIDIDASGYVRYDDFVDLLVK